MEHTLTITKYRDISPNVIRKMKRLMLNSTSERLQGFADHDVITLGKPRICGFCFISPFSPDEHFPDEHNSIYLYNLIYKSDIDVAALLDYIRRQYAERTINLDVPQWDEKRERIYETYGFEHIGEYKKNDDSIYNCYTYKAVI